MNPTAKDQVSIIRRAMHDALPVKDLVQIIVEYAIFQGVDWSHTEDVIHTVWPYHYLLVTEDKIACGFACKHWFSLDLKRSARSGSNNGKGQPHPHAQGPDYTSEEILARAGVVGLCHY